MAIADQSRPSAEVGITARPRSRKKQLRRKRLNVYFLQLDDEPTYDIARLARTLNEVQGYSLFGLRWGASFNFHVVDRTKVENKDLCNNIIRYYWPEQRICDADELIDALHAEEKQIRPSDADLVIGFTSEFFAVANKDGAPVTPADFIFGHWKNSLHKTSVEREFALISVKPWYAKYEAESYRDVYQYLAYMVACFLGDYLYFGEITDGGKKRAVDGLSHSRIYNCVFDYNDITDTIVNSIKASRLCGGCAARLREAGKDLVGMDPERLLANLEGILKYARRPRPYHILRYLREDPIIGFLLTGVFISGLAEAGKKKLGENFELELALCIVFSVVIVGMLVKQHYRPSGKLK